MALRIACLSVLIPAVIAVPKLSHQPQASAGFLTGGSYGTGISVAPYGHINSTAARSIGAGSVPTSVATVVPLPASTKVSPEFTTLTAVSTAPLVDSSDVASQPLYTKDGDVKSPNAAFDNIDTCGPATVTVTEANTVTVTVDAVSASTSLTSSDKVDLSSQPGPEIPPAELSANTLPTVHPHISILKHGHNHAKFHHNPAASSMSKSVHLAKPIQPPTSSSPAPLITTSDVPVRSESSSTRQALSAPNVTPKIDLAYSASQVTEPSTHTTSASSKPPVSHPVSEPSAPPKPHSLGLSVPSSSSSSEAESKPSASSPALSSRPKRGLVYNTAALTENFSSSSVISWCYNWDSQPGGAIPSQFNFVPMMWGPLPVHIDHWKSNADAAIAAGSTHLLGFNEPDLAEQANLTPEQAIKAWHEHMEPYSGRAKLGSPAVCNGGGTVGLNWLERFLDGCSSCTIDFIAIHWYGLASDAGVGYFKEHVAKAVQTAQGRPVWITEFKPDGSPEDQARWLAQVLPWLDDESQSGVERYAYYQVDNILVTGDKLTELGSQYAE